MQRSDDHQDSTTSTEIHKPLQETGDSVLESSTTVGNFCNVNGTLLTDSVASVEIDMRSYASFLFQGSHFGSAAGDYLRTAILHAAV